MYAYIYIQKYFIYLFNLHSLSMAMSLNFVSNFFSSSVAASVSHSISTSVSRSASTCISLFLPPSLYSILDFHQ